VGSVEAEERFKIFHPEGKERMKRKREGPTRVREGQLQGAVIKKAGFSGVYSSRRRAEQNDFTGAKKRIKGGKKVYKGRLQRREQRMEENAAAPLGERRAG